MEFYLFLLNSIVGFVQFTIAYDANQLSSAEVSDKFPINCIASTELVPSDRFVN